MSHGAKLIAGDVYTKHLLGKHAQRVEAKSLEGKIRWQSQSLFESSDWDRKLRGPTTQAMKPGLSMEGGQNQNGAKHEDPDADKQDPGDP